MGIEKEKLYEALGELVYVVAKADGVIQDEEVSELNKILENHPWASTIEWSCEYEKSKNSVVEDVYKKAIDFCKEYGPTKEYSEFIDLMNKVAYAHQGIAKEEKDVINSFSKDLTERFLKDIENLK